jgi:Icc-related predicted phosphoesterase
MLVKIAAISDFHMRFDFEIPTCDLLIVAGDALMMTGSEEQLVKFNNFLSAQRSKFDQCLFIPGNHEHCFEDFPEESCALISEAEVLIDRLYNYKGMKIWGMPWTPPFGNMAFMADRKKMKEKCNLIPEKLDVLVTHGPPKGMLDALPSGLQVGCEDLTERLESMMLPPVVHIFGHIHHAHGIVRESKTTYYNVAMCSDKYKVIHQPTVIDYRQP